MIYYLVSVTVVFSCCVCAVDWPSSGYGLVQPKSGCPPAFAPVPAIMTLKTPHPPVDGAVCIT